MKRLIHRFTLALLVLTCSVSISHAQRWEAVNVPAEYAKTYWYDIYFLPSNPQFGWACGLGGKVLRTTDGGVTWNGSRVPIPLNDTGHLESIHFVTTSIGYTSGKPGIFRTTDGGATWKDITPADAGSVLWGTYFVTADTGMVVGGGCTSPPVRNFYRTTNGGLTWSVFRETTAVGVSGLTDLYLTSHDGIGWAMSSGYMWQTTDGGKTWAIKSTTGGVVWHEEFTKYNYSHLIPCSGNVCDGDGNIGGIKFSIDDGNSWNSYVTPLQMYGTFLLGERSGWAVGVGAQVYYTSDAGASWALKNCGVKSHCDDIWFVNDSIGWIAAENAIYRLRPAYRSTSKVAIDFGERCFPSESYDTLYVRLQSFEAEVGDIVISGTDEQDFSIHQPIMPLIVKGCDSTRVIVKFKPKSTGEKSAKMRITYGTPPTVFEIPLAAKSEGLTAQSIDSVLDFGNVSCGKSVQKSLTLLNGAVQQVTVKKANKLKQDTVYTFVTQLPINVQSGLSEQLVFGAFTRDTGLVENKYKILINTCDFFVTVKAYGKSPIVNHPKIFSIKAQCSNTLIDSIPIENTGNAPLDIYSVNISTSDPQNFSIIGWNKNGDRTTTIPPKQKGWLKIRYNVTIATKISKAILQLTCNDSTTKRGNKTAFSIDVDAHFAGPLIVADKGPINVGTFCIDEEGRAVFKVRNRGTTYSTMTYIETVSKRARVLWREGFPAPQQLANEDSANVTVIFKATKEGIIHDTVELHFQPCSEVIRIPVYCTGKYVKLVTQPDAIKGTIIAGKPIQRTVTLRNIGSAVAEVNTAYLDPVFPDWKIVGFPSPLFLAPNSDYPVTIEMVANEEKVYKGQICFVANKECFSMICTPIIIQAITSGIGLSVTELNFPQQKCSSLPDTSEIVIKNEGTLADTVTEIQLLKNTTDFQLINPVSLPYTLNGGQSVTIRIVYSPTNEGLHSGEVKITSKRSSVPFIIPMSSSYKIANTAPERNSLDFGLTEQCSEPISEKIVFNNSGMLDDTVFVSRSNPLNGVEMTETIIIVPAKSSADFTITVNPSLLPLGTYSEIFSYATAVCPKKGEIAVQGENVLPKIDVDPTVITAQDVLLDENKDVDFTIKNNSKVKRTISFELKGNNYSILSAPVNPFDLLPDSEEKIRVRFMSPIAGEFKGELFVVATSDCVDSVSVPLNITVPDVQYSNTVSMKKHAVNWGSSIDFPLWQTGNITDAECDSAQIAIIINNKLFDVRSVKRSAGNSFVELPYRLNGDTIKVTLRKSDGIDIAASDTLLYINGYTLSYVTRKTPLFINEYKVFSRRAVTTKKNHGELEILYGCFVAVPIPIGSVETTIISDNENAVIIRYQSSFGNSPVRLSVSEMLGKVHLSTQWLQASTTPQDIILPKNLSSGVYFLTVQTAYSTTHHKFVVY